MAVFVFIIALIWIAVFGYFEFYKIGAIGGMLLIVAMILVPLIGGGVSSGSSDRGRDIDD